MPEEVTIFEDHYNTNEISYFKIEEVVDNPRWFCTIKFSPCNAAEEVQFNVRKEEFEHFIETIVDFYMRRSNASNTTSNI